MNIFKNILEKQLFLALQEGVEISGNPLKSIEKKLNLSEDEILDSYSSFVEKGLVRRFGAVFEPSGLAYQSVLCAARIDGWRCSVIAERIKEIKEITHCYTRDYDYNLWFTFTAKRTEFRLKLDAIRVIFGSEIFELSAVKKFKTEVVFNLGLPVARASRPCSSKEIIDFDFTDISISDSLYDICASKNIFRNAAKKLGLTESFFLQKLNLWKSCGALKRIGLIPYHKHIGYKANAMCVWQVVPALVEPVGRELAKRSNITHCYERMPVKGAFPYNLFAMMHSDTLEHLRQEFDLINSSLHLPVAKMLTTIDELKKSSFKPF